MKNDNKTEDFRNTFFNDIGLRDIYEPTVPVVIIAAHPDDETIGAFSILNNFTNIKVIHTTDGAPKNMIDAQREGFETREGYAAQRRYELYNVLSYLGILESNCTELKISDQEASYHLDLLVIKLIKILNSIKPQFVFTHSYEGGHPDHDSTAFAVHTACKILKVQENISPAIIEFALYNSYNGNFMMNKFIPYDSCAEKVVIFNDSEMKVKKDVLNFFSTQQYLIKNYNSTIESFRAAPDYDFSKPPHKGKINYDNFDWGIKNNEWCEIALATIKMFSLETSV